MIFLKEAINRKIKLRQYIKLSSESNSIVEKDIIAISHVIRSNDSSDVFYECCLSFQSL